MVKKNQKKYKKIGTARHGPFLARPVLARPGTARHGATLNFKKLKIKRFYIFATCCQLLFTFVHFCSYMCPHRQTSADVGRRPMSADVGRHRPMSTDVGSCLPMSANIAQSRSSVPCMEPISRKGALSTLVRARISPFKIDIFQGSINPFEGALSTLLKGPY